MTNILQYPDSEGSVRTWARAHSGLQAKFGNPARIFFGIPDVPPAYPLMTLSRIGGAPEGGDYPLDSALISFAVWGANKAQAADAAMTLINAIQNIADSTTAGTAVLMDGTVTLMLWSPDPQDRARYIVDARFTLRVQAIV